MRISTSVAAIIVTYQSSVRHSAKIVTFLYKTSLRVCRKSMTKLKKHYFCQAFKILFILHLVTSSVVELYLTADENCSELCVPARSFRTSWNNLQQVRCTESSRFLKSYKQPVAGTIRRHNCCNHWLQKWRNPSPSLLH